MSQISFTILCFVVYVAAYFVTTALLRRHRKQVEAALASVGSVLLRRGLRIFPRGRTVPIHLVRQRSWPKHVPWECIACGASPEVLVEMVAMSLRYPVVLVCDGCLLAGIDEIKAERGKSSG